MYPSTYVSFWWYLCFIHCKLLCIKTSHNMMRNLQLTSCDASITEPLPLCNKVTGAEDARVPSIAFSCSKYGQFSLLFPETLLLSFICSCFFYLRLANTTNVLKLPVLLSKVFHLRSTLLPCLVVAFFTYFTSDLLEDVPVSMRTIQAALYTFITPYTNKHSCIFGTPATTHFVYFHVNPRANVTIRARYQAHALNTNTRNIHVITGLQL